MKSCLAIVPLVLFLVIAPAASSVADERDNMIPPLQDGSPGCWQHSAAYHSGTPHMVEQSIDSEITAFQNMAEEVLAVRAETIKVAELLMAKAEMDIAFTGADLDLLSQGIALHLALRKQLLEVAYQHECWLDMTREDMKLAGLTPESQLKGVMLSLSAALVLYDNYLLAISLYEGDSKLRRLINEGDPGYRINQAELSRVTLSYNSIGNRSRVRRAMEYYENAIRQNPGLRSEPATAYLVVLIEQSPSYAMVREWSPLYVIGQKLGFLSGVTYDSVVDLERNGINLFSMLFGNTVGLVETRKGKLFLDDRVATTLRRELQAGDILLEKTPFRLTDKLIPGYWGHAALWTGTEDELRTLGIWMHPVVREHHAEIRSGRIVVEALRSGVEMNPLEKFMNIDSIGILRKRGISNAEKAEVVLQALRQVGKGYDFNFDVETKDKVYCSKLIYMAYHDVPWPVDRSMGRVTFTPDDVATRAKAGGELDLVTFYHDGSPVAGNRSETMATLMNGSE